MFLYLARTSVRNPPVSINALRHCNEYARLSSIRLAGAGVFLFGVRIGRRGAPTRAL